MIAVKGIYRNGKVELLEPIDLPEPQEVVVTFESSAAPDDPVAATEAVFGLLGDLSDEDWERFLETTRRTEPFFGVREIDWNDDAST
jgi:hypothetical protein